MRFLNKLLIPMLVLGLAGITQAKGRNTGLAESLKSAHKLLVEADHDYKGHRAKAAERVHMALKELGLEPASSAIKGTGTKKTGHAGESHEREPQAASDAKLREALKILQGISTQTANKGVAAHIKGAIKEIDTALSVK